MHCLRRSKNKMAHNFVSRSVSMTSSTQSTSSTNCRVRCPGRGAGSPSVLSDDGFEVWRRCPKCHHPLIIPKALPCLHTVCLHCLRIHYQTVRMQVATQAEEHPNKYNFYSWEGCFPCPICSYPCYILPEGLTTVPTNKRLLRLTFKERLYRHIENQQREEPVGSNSLQSSAQVSESREEAQRDFGTENLMANSELSESVDAQGCTENDETNTRSGNGNASKNDSDTKSDAEPGDGEVTTAESGASAQSVTGQGSLQQVINSVAAVAYCSPSVLDWVKEDENIMLHWKHVAHECRGKEEELLYVEEDPPVTGHREAKHVCTFALKRGDDDVEIQHPNAIAVNPHTGHLVVVDTTWNKAVLYKTHTKPFSYKKFQHPILDVCFYPPSETDRVERFCAMGRRSDRKGIMVYKAPFNKNPTDFTCTYQKNVRDVSGLLLIKPNTLVISLCYVNTVIHQINEKQFVDLATRQSHGIVYPTHLTYTVAKEVVVADTGNHRIGVFYGPELLAFDFYGEYGSEYGKFFYPMGLATDKDRHLYICDANNYRVQVFNRYFQFESCPITHTYLMGDCVSQDVKPIDCAINNKQNLLILFRGRHFMSLQMYQYFEPRFVYTMEDEISTPLTMPETVDPSCWRCCLLCSCCWCCKTVSRPDRTLYEPIN